MLAIKTVTGECCAGIRSKHSGSTLCTCKPLSMYELLKMRTQRSSVMVSRIMTTQLFEQCGSRPTVYSEKGDSRILYAYFLSPE